MRDRDAWLWEIIECKESCPEKVIDSVINFLVKTKNANPEQTRKKIKHALKHPYNGDPSWNTSLIRAGIITAIEWNTIINIVAKEVLSKMSDEELKDIYWVNETPLPE